jgi:hypothetical protein
MRARSEPPVIANTSSGKRFGPLATYLVSGRSGSETDRVAWTAGRNIGTDDPALAAPLMQATARQSVLLQSPVYHLTVSFDHQDEVTPEQMQSVVDRVLRDLGLSEHQALMVAHKDTEHAHVHVMVNRVHPDTGVAWERWQDRPTIERALREEEQARGLRSVPGRLHQVEGLKIPERAALSPGERRQAERTGDPAFVARVQAMLPELRSARSWEELSSRLAEHGVRVEGKGQGLVFTDGEHEVKASRVGRDLSLRRLEERFHTPYPNREQLRGVAVTAQAELSRGAATLASNIREYERVATLGLEQYRSELEVLALQSDRDRLAEAVHAINRASDGFNRALRLVYLEPEGARQRIRESAIAGERTQLAASLRQEPQRFGTLRTEEERHAFGLLTTQNDSQARVAAHQMARAWTDLARHEQQASEIAVEYAGKVERRFEEMLAHVYRNPAAARHAFDLAQVNAGIEEAVRILAHSPDRLGALRAPGTPLEVARLDWTALSARAREAHDARSIMSSELANSHVDRATESLSKRKREVRSALESAPSLTLLERAIGRAVERLEPDELTQLRRALTAPQAALAFKAHRTIRDVVLGRDEHER